MKSFFAGLVALSLPLATLAADAPPVTIKLGQRCAKATPCRKCCFSHMGGGNIDVQQPTDDRVIITMTGVAVTCPCPTGCKTAHMNVDLDQCFSIEFADPKKVKLGKLTLEGRVIGLLRSPCKNSGTASLAAATACVTCGPSEILCLALPPHAVGCKQHLSINDQDVACMPVIPGCYTLHQAFAVGTQSPKCILPVSAVSAEFAPDPALDPLWISAYEPFHGAAKKDFGFQVILTVAPADEDDTPADEEPAKLPMEKPMKK